MSHIDIAVSGKFCFIIVYVYQIYKLYNGLVMNCDSIRAGLQSTGFGCH
jgi:hypothetical protein